MTDEERKALWQKIQSSDPQLAKVLEEVREKFGRPTIENLKFKEVS